MDNLDDSETNAKVPDSAYSTSGSNSQSRRSHSSKSTLSGSHSSGSSGYGENSSAYRKNNDEPTEKRVKEKDGKKKEEISVEVDPVPEESPLEPSLQTQRHATNTSGEQNCEETENVEQPTSPQKIAEEQKETTEVAVQVSKVSVKDEEAASPPCTSIPAQLSSSDGEGFSVVISMQDGVVKYTTNALTTMLGYPKDLWIGRSFIDFVHSRDRSTFASHITTGLAIPKSVNGTIEKDPKSSNCVCTMVCRIRKYRDVSATFGVKECTITFMPFLLTFCFKNFTDESGDMTYLVVQSTPFFSAFKMPYEIVTKAVPFVIRHSANGNVEYIDPEAVPYLGYLPQDLINKNALLLYHPDDLVYLRQVYEALVKEGGLPRSKPYRMITQNGDFIKVATEWSSFINPWSRKLELVFGKHYIVEGPENPDVFQTPSDDKYSIFAAEDDNKHRHLRENIIRVMDEVLTKPAVAAREHKSKNCQQLTSLVENIIEKSPKVQEQLQVEVQPVDNSYHERDSFMLGAISPHHDHSDSISSTETQLSYTQINYNETLQRFFESHEPFTSEEIITSAGERNTPKSTVTVDELPKATSQGTRSGANSRRKSKSNSSLASSDTWTGASLSGLSDKHPTVRLTENLLCKHNTEMEKLMMKTYRVSRSSSKGEREKTVNKDRQNKKEHLARCNAAFQPTSRTNMGWHQSRGVKRPSRHHNSDGSSSKRHCPHTRRRQYSSAMPPPTTTTVVTTNTHSHTPSRPPLNPWENHASMAGINPCFLEVGSPQHLSHIALSSPGMLPMYYAPWNAVIGPSTTYIHDMARNNPTPGPSSSNMYHQPLVPYMMYGLPPPYAYSPMSMNPQVTYAIPQNQAAMHQAAQRPQTYMPLGLNNSNYEKSTQAHGSGTFNHRNERKAKVSSDETVDEESSNMSSFYSSFLHTDSGSGTDTGDAARKCSSERDLSKVSVTSHLVYRYRIVPKNLEEVLKADLIKLEQFKQSNLLDEQLDSLYSQLRLEGDPEQLCFAEEVRNSNSSNAHRSPAENKMWQQRIDSSNALTYEDDAGFPEPDDSFFLCPSSTSQATVVS